MEKLPKVQGVNVEKAVKAMGGNLQGYEDLLGGFCREIPKKSEAIRALLKEKNYAEFTILVHGLKSASRMLGMEELSEKMEEMENAGTDGDFSFVRKNIQETLAFFESYEEILKKFDKREIPSGVCGNELLDTLLRLHDAIEDFEIDAMEELFGQLSIDDFPKNAHPLYRKFIEAMDEIDYYKSLEIVDKLIEVVK